MDLIEWKKSWNVWRLESEAFKDPIEIKIWYENKELAEFNARCSNLEWELKERGRENKNLKDKFKEQQEWLIHFWELLEAFHGNIDKAWNKIDEQVKESKELYKAIADAKNVIELQSGTILKLQEQVKLLEKKITKQPMVFHDKWFISWRESSGLWMINIPDGDYLMIMNTKVGEHNEYVINKDELIMEKIHVEGQHYVPFYKLEWGTELDTPTATIYYDLVFIPM